jgi:acyl-CoA thioesterase FadM
MEFEYQVVKIQDQTIAASGKTVHAAVDPSGKPCRLPERVREVFA